MELLRGLESLVSGHRPCVATIGAFDGVHRGHAAVIRQLREQGERLGLPTTLVTFEPLPREYFAQPVPPRLQSFREKIETLREQGVDRLVCLRFNDRLRSMSAGEFAERLFVEGLAVKALILGDDFRFGHDREGDIDFVRRLGADAGFVTLPTTTVEVDGERVSSTRLRNTLAQGDFVLAERLLGRPYSISGRVVYGKQLGRQIGVPTANIALRRQVVPLSGVYAVTVSGPGLEAVPAIANVGTRPTIDDGVRANLEVHLLEQGADFYGKRLHTHFRHKLREEQRFDSVDALKNQIHKDIEAASAWLTAATHNE